MRRRTFAVLLLVGLFAPCALAHAHFLFMRVNEPAEAGRTVEVFFSEKADAGDPRFIGNVAGATLTVQSKPAAAGGESLYGVFARGSTTSTKG